MMEYKSIFDIERRKDFSTLFLSFLDDICSCNVKTSSGSVMRVIEYLEYCIKYWPYRKSASNIRQYLLETGMDFNAVKNDNERLMVMELMVNLLHYSKRLDEKERNPFNTWFDSPATVEKESNRLLENATHILEQCCNMQIRATEVSSEEEPQYFISKRDAYVDATIETTPVLSEWLLGYLDIRNKDDSQYKEDVLIEMYKYMEPKRKKYKENTVGAISEEFFKAINTFGIRHNTESQIHLSDNIKNGVYDKLFKMALFVLQCENVQSIKKEIEQVINVDGKEQ